MYVRQIFLTFLHSFIWIHAIYGLQVMAFMQDGLNPVNNSLWHQRVIKNAIEASQGLACEKPIDYICEAPPETVPLDATKYCNYRNVRHPEQIYRWMAGQGCLVYTPGFLFVAGTNTINLNVRCFYGKWFIPCLEIAKEDGTCGCYPFDPGFEEVAAAISEAVVPTAQGRWERCFYAASDCCSHYMQEELITEDNRCETTFDGWTCYHNVEGGTLASEICSEFAYSNTGPSCHHFSSKNCYENGTWDPQTDYSTCSITPRLLVRYRYYIAILAFSIVTCLPAVFIFFFYKRLRITRVILHRNLLVSIILRNILVIISRNEIYIDELTNTGMTTMAVHSVACQVLAFAERFFGNVVFVCMLVEGVYLHRTIVTVFRKKLKIRLLYGVGFVIALVPAIAWAAVMAVYNNHSCWIVYTVDHIQWILDAPRVAILLVNTVLFIDVLRVLLTKIRNSENTNQLNTAKATLFLMPLFGSQFLLTAFRPNTTDCTLEQFYYYVAYTVEGLQGFIVAILFCYVNKEVHVLIKQTYKKTENAVVSRIRGDSIAPHVSMGPSTDRRMTYSTELPSKHNDDPKEQYETITPKLQVAEIISMQAIEPLEEILEPVYETIQDDMTNDSYDYLARSDIDNDSGYIRNRDSKEDDYYTFTNTSNISMDDCVSSPSISVYNNSNNDESKYPENKCPIHNRFSDISHNSVPQCVNCSKYKDMQPVNNDVEAYNPEDRRNGTGGDDYEDMLDEIMEYIDTTENQVPLDSIYLSPNRSDDA